MVKDLKYIIKRVIIGVLISLAIMFLKTNVFALECGMSDIETKTALNENAVNQISGQGIQNIFASPYVSINFNSDYSYYILKIPFTFTINMQSSFTGGQSTQQNISAATRIVDKSTGSNLLYFGEVKNGFLEFKINSSVKISEIDIYVSNFYYNFETLGLRSIIYTRWTIEKYKCSDSTSAQQQTTQAVQDQTNTLKDDSIDESGTSSSINDLSNNNASNGTISSLLTLPITLYSKVLDSIGGTCSTWNLGSLLNHNLVLPCIDLSDLLGSTLYGIIDILISGLFILGFRKKMVDIFNHMTTLNDRGNELE